MPGAAVAIAVAIMVALAALSDAQTPKMGGGDRNMIAIPVDDPQTKAIGRALYKPAGAGPFPAVIYMGTCASIDSGEETFMQNALRGRLISKGFAMLIVDPYSLRQEPRGVCDKAKVDGDYDARGARDIYAAMEVLGAMPEIDANRIFVEGYSLGASAVLSAIDVRNVAAHKAKLAGAIAFSPFCRQDAALSVPALILVGDRDIWTSAKRCRALERTPHVKVVVYPGVGHGFVMPFGHHAQYDNNAAGDATVRAEAFLDSPHLLRRLLPGRANQKARHDRLLMHVQTTTPLDDRLHHRLRPSGGDRDAAGTFETLLHVLLVPEGDKEWYLYAARAGLPIGVVSHRSFISLARSPVAKAPINRPASPPPFSPIMARRRRWSAAKGRNVERDAGICP